MSMPVLLKAKIVPATGLALDAFEADRPMQQHGRCNTSDNAAQSSLIDGVELTGLLRNEDARGSLHELLTTREGPTEPIVHVYQVSAAPGSIRAWVYHRHQHDRLAFTNGDIEVVLYDLRPGSSTQNHLNVLKVGKNNPCLLRIPPCVVHGVRNAGDQWAYFTNMPTSVYHPDRPDKYRLAYGDPRIPYIFE
jgi:dTDP-4-dehydrorhamnose 3,5-epimerase